MTPPQTPARVLRWHQRLHAALMPDYNPAATVYWWTAVVIGALVLLWSLRVLASLPALALVQVAVGLALAVAAGLFPVRIPGTRVSLAAGEMCIFLVMLLQGPEAAAVVAAGEAAMGSFRTSKRWTSRLGSPSMAAVAMFASASLLAWAMAALSRRGIEGPVPLLAAAMVFGFAYFIFSATLMGGVARLRRGKHLLQLGEEARTLRWVGLAYSGSALVSALLFTVYQQAGIGVLLVTLPLLAMLLLVLHFYYRQQEAEEAMRRALAEVAEREAVMRTREAETAARHTREMQLSERRFHGAFTYASIGMALVDLDARVIRANEALGRLAGRRADELAGVPVAQLVHPADAERLAAELGKAQGLEFEDFDLALRLIDSRRVEHPVRLHCSFFRGPAEHGSATPGRPCLILQIQRDPGPEARASGPSD